MFEKLGKNPEFQKVYKTGRSKANKYLVMYVKTGESGPSRYGFSVSKKVGNSVVRHRITRLLRESVRKNDALVKEGNRIIIIARKDVKEKIDKSTLESDIYASYIANITLYTQDTSSISKSVSFVLNIFTAPLYPLPDIL